MINKSELYKELPDGWDIKPLPDCIEKASISRDIKIPQSNYAKYGKYPIIDQGFNFVAGFTDDDSKLYTGDLPVIVFGDHTRIFKYVDFPFSLGADGTKLLRPRDFLDPKYFYFYLWQLPLESKGYNRHYKYLKEKSIIFPEKTEQQKIALIISKIQQVTEKQEKIIAKTKELKRSLMHQLFTYGLRSDELKETENGLMPVSWSLVPLEKIAEVIYGAQAAVAHALDSSIGTPIFTNINITNNGDLNLATLRYYKVPDKKRDRLILEKGDILFNWRSGSKDHVGKTAFFDLDGEYTFSSFILRFRTKKTINNIYLYWYLQFLKSIGYFSQYRDQSSVNSVFNASAASVIPVAVCGKEEQIEIGETLCAVNNKIKEEQNRLFLMKNLFKSMLNNLMTGQVRVKDMDFEDGVT